MLALDFSLCDMTHQQVSTQIDRCISKKVE